jgi:hypothetical protein
MQTTRLKLLRDLEDMFNMAKGSAQNKKKTKTGEPIVSAKQKQIWIRIMAYTGQVMNSISKSFDEAQVTKDLERLEKLINETMAKEKGGRTKAAG